MTPTGLQIVSVVLGSNSDEHARLCLGNLGDFNGAGDDIGLVLSADDGGSLKSGCCVDMEECDKKGYLKQKAHCEACSHTP
jgi:hypothetical protein